MNEGNIITIVIVYCLKTNNWKHINSPEEDVERYINSNDKSNKKGYNNRRMML
jgi:hypothetical protein